MTEMTPAEALFFAAAALPATERAAYLARACADDEGLRRRVEKMLAAQPDVGQFLEPDDAGENTAAGTQASASREPIAATVAATCTDAPAAAAPAPDEQIGSLLGGKYRLVEAIGEGGMGSVYMARQTEPVKRNVAVKVIKAGMDSRAVLARFEAERQALALMDHPNIARVLDAGATESGRPYFVMELVKGVPITQFCDERRLTPRQRLELFVPVCQAIQHAHQKGVIHRDIKPSNVLVALYDDKPVPKVIDFGVAKAAGPDLTDVTLMTGFGAVVGTPEYMSPEQASLNNLDVDTRSDVYSLGVLLYELLTGSTPVDRKSLQKAALMEVLRIVREVEVPRPSARLSTIDTLPSVAASRGVEPARLSGLLKGELDWVLLKALEKDRARRYETANALARDIQRYLADEVVEARPPSAGYRVRKFARRHKGRVLAGGLILLALLLGIVGTTIGQIRAERQRRLAVDHANEARVMQARETLQRKRAEEFRDRALAALRATTGEDVTKLIGSKTDLGPNERAYLEAVARRWQAFAREEGTDEQSRVVRAEGHSQVALLWSRLGRGEDARREYEKAVALFERLAADFPAVPAYRDNLASRLNGLGVLLASLGKRAEDLHRRAVALGEMLVLEKPAEPAFRQTLAASHSNLGIALQALGKWAEAEEHERRAVVLYERLATEAPADTARLEDIASGHTNLGALLYRTNRYAEAEPEYRRSLSICEKLAADPTADPDLRKRLIMSYSNLGGLLNAQGKGTEAELTFRRAVALAETLATEFPSVPGFRLALVVCRTNLGRALRDLGNPSAAEPELRAAVAVAEKLAADFPAVHAHQEQLARAHGQLGLLLRHLEKWGQAADEYRRAVALRERLVADSPAVLDYRLNLGGDDCNVGVALLLGDDPAAAVEWFGKAIEILRSLHDESPRYPQVQDFLRNSYANRAVAYDQVGDAAHATVDADRAIELSPPAEKPAYRANRAVIWARSGRVEEAVTEAAELAAVPGQSANRCQLLACVYALASERSVDRKVEYADRAVELLRKAVAAGLSSSAIEKEKDLASIRDRPDFQKLVAEVKAKAAKTLAADAKPQEKK